VLSNNNNIKYKKQLKFIKFNYKKKAVPKITFEQFQSKFMHDFYTMKQRSDLKIFLNISEAELNYSLCNQYVLLKYFKRKFNSFFKKKFRIIAKRYYKRYRPYVKKKKRKKKINLRFKKFFRINYDNFLFYLKVSNKQFIVKPFNFLHCLFFFKTKLFQRKPYVLRRRRKRTKLYYKLRRIRGKRRLRRCRMRRIRYSLKKKILFKRFKLRKFKLFKNFFRVIAFMNFCKKKTLSIDDNFKIKSSSRLRYKFLKFHFNKISNSYKFFMHLKRRKQKIKFFFPKTNFVKQKLNLSSIFIKFNLQNKFVNRNNKNNVNKKKLHLLICSNNKNFSELDFNVMKSKKYIKLKNNNNFSDYLISTNLIKNAINNNFYDNNNETHINTNKSYKLIFMIKLINKLSKKIKFFEKKIIKIKLKQKKKVLRLSKKLLKISLKNQKKFKKSKKIVKKLLYIIINLKNKLKKIILNFYILFSYYNEKINNIKKNNFLVKIFYFLKKKNNKKYTMLKKRKHLFSLLSLDFHKRAITPDNKYFIYFSKKKKTSSRFEKWFNQRPAWIIKRFIKKQRRRKRKSRLRHIKNHWNLSNCVFYKNYFNTNNLSFINRFYSFFFFKKFKINYLNFLKKKNFFYFKNIQNKKNIEFLK
jgi:hypothetical protein